MAVPYLLSSGGYQWVEPTESELDSVPRSCFESFVCWAWTRFRWQWNETVYYRQNYQKHSSWKLYSYYLANVWPNFWHPPCGTRRSNESRVRTLTSTVDIISDPFNTSTTSKWLHTWWIHLMRKIQTWAICRGPKVKHFLIFNSDFGLKFQVRLIFAGRFHAPQWYELLVRFWSRNCSMREKLINGEKKIAWNSLWFIIYEGRYSPKNSKFDRHDLIA